MSLREKVYIIAEAGVNHNGNIENAVRLIKEAKLAGADAVKFQTYKTENIITEKAPKAKYQLKQTSNTESQFEMLKKLELKKDDFIFLKDECKKANIDFLSTPYSFEDVDFLDSLNVKYFKVASGQLTEHLFLKHIASKKRRVILSTGMASLSEVFDSVLILKSHKIDPIVLQCTTNYPSIAEEANLRAMLAIQESCGVEVGYSDHVYQNYSSYAAVALGATIIEKHFTLSNAMKGPDHKSSLNPENFKKLVTGIREVEKSLGSSIKTASTSEMENIFAMRRGSVAKTNIKKGEILSLDKIAFKRPMEGIDPKNIEFYFGKKVNINITKDQPLKDEYFKN